jgi:PAS domain-containing protein
MSVVIGPEKSPWGVLGVHATRRIEFTVDDTNFLTAIAHLLWDAIRRVAYGAELLDSRARLAAFMSNSTVVGWMKNEQGKYVYWSDSLARQFGVTEEDCLDKTDDEVWPPKVEQAIN